MLYVAGSLLFAFALVAALAVIAASFAHYRVQMVAALRTLSLDGIHEPAKRRPSGLSLTPRLDRPALPARRLAA